jgi:hypothetical protein
MIGHLGSGAKAKCMVPLVHSLCASLGARQRNSGAWGFVADQDALEPTCLAVLALRQQSLSRVENARNFIRRSQHQDGSWPAVGGASHEGCWITALAILTLIGADGDSDRLSSAIDWLLRAHGREGGLVWRLKFRFLDTGVRFDPAKYGWNWVPGTTSWVIPTAFAILALRHAKHIGFAGGRLVDDRIKLGIEMLLDRMCPGGGWNAGNGVAFGVPYQPYVDATGIALLALRGQENEAGVQASLRWLAEVLPRCRSPYSLAWGILGLAAYSNRDADGENALGAAADALVVSIEKTPELDVATLAACALAFEAFDGANVFEV